MRSTTAPLGAYFSGTLTQTVLGLQEIVITLSSQSQKVEVTRVCVKRTAGTAATITEARLNTAASVATAGDISQLWQASGLPSAVGTLINENISVDAYLPNGKLYLNLGFNAGADNVASWGVFVRLMD
jgi:ribose 1,5-bisphosphokinase PhnN